MDFQLIHLGFLSDFFDVCNILASGLINMSSLVIAFLTTKLNSVFDDFSFLDSVAEYILGATGDISIGAFFIGSGVFVYLVIRVVKFLVGIFT